jgi:hypothetical protein
MAQEKGNGTRALFPNADTINFDDEQLPAVMVHRKRWFLTVLKQPVDGAIGVWRD